MKLKQQHYIDFRVYSITSIKNGYGYRIKLIYEDNEKIIQKSGFKTKKEANDSRNLTITELYNGTFVINDNVKVKDLFIEWLEDERKPQITVCSYNSYKNIVYNYIVPEIGNIKLSMLNSGNVQDLYNKISIESISVAKLLKTVMNNGLKFALKNSLISSNPAQYVDLPKCVKQNKSRNLEINIQKTLNKQQVKILIEKSKSTPIYLQILFAVLMGLRKSEINGLKYDDIDFVHRTIHVQRQLGNKANVNNEELKKGEYTKQEIKLKTVTSNRILRIPNILFEAILEEKKKYEKNRSRRINDMTTPFKDYGYICCSTYGNPRSKTFHFKYFKKLLEENNLPNIRFHDLRATYCTLLIKEDFSLKAISKLMGHSTEIISADVYGDNKEIIEDCLEELEPFIESVLPKQNNKNIDFSKDEEILEITEKFINELNIN